MSGAIGRDQDAAAQAVLLDPLHVLDRVVDVVQEDLADAGATLREAAAPVGHPAVVRADAGEPVLVLVGRRRAGEEDEAREERRDGVGEHDLGDDAVGLFVADAALVVPVADPAAVLQVAERVLVLLAPGVEVVEVLLLEVLAVHLVVRAGVAVGRDDRVVVVGLHRARHAPHSTSGSDHGAPSGSGGGSRIPGGVFVVPTCIRRRPAPGSPDLRTGHAECRITRCGGRTRRRRPRTGVQDRVGGALDAVDHPGRVEDRASSHSVGRRSCRAPGDRRRPSPARRATRGRVVGSSPSSAS